MGKMRVKLPSILRAREWPSCKQNPRTMSFREEADHSHIFKTLNSVYFDHPSASAAVDVETPESWFSRNTSGGTASCPSSEEEEEEVDVDDDPAVEAVIRGALASDVENSRLLFKPEKTSSILTEKEEEKKNNNNIIISSPSSYDELVNLVDDDDDDGYPSNFNFKESVVMAMESEDPYMDFRRSMEEMVETHGLIKDWACLEELLGWYLRVNGKNNHAYIVGAFVDLLLAFSALDSSDYYYNDNNNNNSNTSNPIICNQYQQQDEDEDPPPPPSSTNNIIGSGCRGSTLSSSSSSPNSCSSSSSLPKNNIIINTTNHKKQLSITSFSSAASSFRSSSELD